MIEWKPMLLALLEESDIPLISAKFHNTLAAIIVAVAEQVESQSWHLVEAAFRTERC